MSNNTKWRKVGGGDFPPSFRFTKPGQWLTGKFVEIRDVDSDEFEKGKATFITVDVSEASEGSINGKVSLMGHGLLLWLLKEAKLEAGDLVKITYQGKEKYKDGRKTREGHRYTVEVPE